MAEKGLHLVFGGELIDPAGSKFRNIEEVELIGLYSDYASAHDAWKEVSQQAVDNALKRYFIARLAHLIHETNAPEPAREIDH